MCVYQLRGSIAVFLATIFLCAGLVIRDAAAQTPAQTLAAAKCDPAAVSCKVSITAVDANGNQQSQSVTSAYGTATWQGLNWGIGIAADFDLGGKRVTGAQIDTVPGGTLVRVTDTSGNVGVSLVLEAHYFFKEWLPFANCRDYNCNDIAIGPFVAIEAGNATTSGSNGPITGYALGLMVGLHHPTTDPKLANSSWNFGVGLRVDPSATVFGDGVRANQPPPPGVTTADQLLKKEPRYGIMLLSSFSF